MVMEMRPLSWARNESTTFRHVEPEADRLLTDSIRQHGILQPPGALRNGRTLWGRRRIACGLAAGLKETLFHVLDREISEEEAKILELTENWQRQQPTDVEIYQGVKEVQRLNPGLMKKELGAKLNKDGQFITRVLSIDDLIPCAREAFLAGMFGLSVAYPMSRGTPEQQAAMLAARLSGEASRDDLVHRVRKARNSDTETAKVSRVRIPLPSGAAIVLTGQDLGMLQVVDVLAEALKDARKCAGQYDVKTWQRMMADRAKAGGQ